MIFFLVLHHAGRSILGFLIKKLLRSSVLYSSFYSLTSAWQHCTIANRSVQPWILCFHVIGAIRSAARSRIQEPPPPRVCCSTSSSSARSDPPPGATARSCRHWDFAILLACVGRIWLDLSRVWLGSIWFDLRLGSSAQLRVPLAQLCRPLAWLS
jgi:hypothetical protein